MKKLIIILIVLISTNSFATKKTTERSTSNNLSYLEYINQFGTNDTSRAIIDYYFDKRELCAGGKMSFLPLSMGIAIVVPPLGIGLAVVSTPLFVSGVITRKRYNHKNLIKALNNYHNENILSEKISEEIGYMMIEEDSWEEELSSNSLLPLQAIHK